MTTRRILRTVGLLGSLCLTGAASAQPGLPATDSPSTDDSLEELLGVSVMSATQTGESEQEAPAIVTVISRSDLRAWGYDSVAEVLRHVVGIHVIDDHVLPSAAVRGVSGGLRGASSLIKVLIDGHSVAFRATGENWLGPELIPLSAVARIEILRGPASALYGADAFVGVINIVTRSGFEVRGAELGMSGGLVGRELGSDQDLALGGQNGPWEYLLALRLHDEDRSGLPLPGSSPGPRLPRYNRNATAASELLQRSRSGFMRLSYDFGGGSSLALSAYGSALQRSAEFADWTQLASGIDSSGRHNQNNISLQQGFVDARLVLELSPALSAHADALVYAGAPRDDERIEVGSDVYYVRRDFGYRGAELDLGLQWQVAPTLSLMAGTGVIVDEQQLPGTLQVLKDSGGGAMAGTIREDTSIRQGQEVMHNPGARLQAVWTAVPRLARVTVGVRYDYHNIYGNNLSGRIGVVSSPRDGLSVKLLYGNAFKAPSPLLLYAVPVSPGDVIGNRALEAQQIHTVEGQLSWQPRAWLALRMGLAYNYLRNKAEFASRHLNLVAQNLAEMASVAVEWEAALNHGGWLTAYANLSLSHTVRNLGEVGYRAELLGSGDASYPGFLANAGVQALLEPLHLRASAELSAVGARGASDSNTLLHAERYSLDPYGLLGASVSTSGLALFDRGDTTLGVTGRNLLGAVGPEPGFGGVDYPLPPRSIWAWLRQTF